MLPGSSRSFKTQFFDLALLDYVVIPSDFLQTFIMSGCAGNQQFLLGRESIHERTGRFVYNCVPVFFERVDKDTDADENVDADHERMGRPVGSHQDIDLFTQREKVNVDFNCETS